MDSIEYSSVGYLGIQGSGIFAIVHKVLVQTRDCQSMFFDKIRCEIRDAVVVATEQVSVAFCRSVKFVIELLVGLRLRDLEDIVCYNRIHKIK